MRQLREPLFAHHAFACGTAAPLWLFLTIGGYAARWFDSVTLRIIWHIIFGIIWHIISSQQGVYRRGRVDRSA